MNTTSKRSGIQHVLAAVLAVGFSLAATAGLAVQPPADDVLLQRYQEQHLRVSLWLDKDSDQVYRRGEPLQITFQTNEDAYVVLYRIDVEGRVDILWPSSRLNDGFVFGGHQYRLPARDATPLRVGDQEGMGYVQAVVSLYPFDLRDLPLDFHHERLDRRFDFFVAGDPYLAMNEVNFEVTGLEDPSEFVITNHVSYYVHRPVDHPRYLCFQCHDDSVAYEPYQHTCTVTIQHDYGWHNRWWNAHGFYPAYYYPVYFYVDPWSGYRWVNYWYDPWYWWPPRSFYSWGFHLYDWRYSPYWHWDSRVAYERGSRRYTPLTKPGADRDRALATTRTKNALVTDARPADDRLRAMKERTVADRGRGDDERSRVRRDAPGGGAPRNVERVSRPQERFETDARLRTQPGLRVPEARAGGRDRREAERGTQPGVREVPRDGSDRRTRDEIRQPSRPGGAPDDRPQVRPVEPRPDGRRVWTNRRSQSPDDPRPTPPVARPPDRRESPRQQPDRVRRDDAGSRRDSSPPSTPPRVTPRQPERPKSPPSTPPRAAPRREQPKPPPSTPPRAAPRQPERPSSPPAAGQRGGSGRGRSEQGVQSRSGSRSGSAAQAGRSAGGRR